MGRLFGLKVKVRLRHAVLPDKRNSCSHKAINERSGNRSRYSGGYYVMMCCIEGRQKRQIFPHLLPEEGNRPYNIPLLYASTLPYIIPRPKII